MNSRNRKKIVVKRGITRLRLVTTIFLVLVGLWLAEPMETNGQTELPDLIIDGSEINPNIIRRIFSSSDCAVVEGCTLPGTRTLLRFNTATRNIGVADLLLGDPSGNPQFEFDECHNHYHFEGFADYRLIDSTGQVAAGHKFGFCLLDLVRHDSDANSSPVYDCNFQGIQSGWTDIYNSGLDCQWIDITNVPPGAYTLEQEVNPDLLLEESDYSNNITAVPVLITATIAPPNDDCIDAIPVTIGTTFFDTTDALTDGPAHQSCTLSGDGGQTCNDIWFTYYAACTGTLTVSTCEQLGGSAIYDTDLVIYDGTDCSNLQFLNCNDDDPGNPCGAATGGYHSTVRASVVAGRSYLIRVGGWSTGDSGTGMLQVINDGSECGICGDGTVNPGEECDPPDDVNCDANCQWICGDGILQDGEECDFGICVQCPGLQECGYNCRFIPVCGNGIAEGDEECDPPDGVVCGDDCRLLNDDNDDCIDAIPVTVGTTFFDTTDALTDGPAHQSCTLSSDGGQTFNDIWFSYYAACTGTLTVSTCEQLGGSAAYDTDLVIYDGTDCSNLQLLNCNDDDPENPCGAATGGYHSTVRAPVVAGRSYLIRVGGWNTNDSGTGMLKVINDGTECGICGDGFVDPGEECDPPDSVTCDDDCRFIPVCGNGIAEGDEECDPPDGMACGDDCRLLNDDNDDCIDAIPVTVGTTFFDTTDALTDGPAHQSCTLSSDGGQTFNDIWFSYYAACTGTLTVSTCEQLGGSAAYDTDLVIYDGTDCSNLQLLNCNDDDPENPCGAATGGYHSTVRAPVVAGRSYLIRVGGWNTEDSGTGMLKVINDGTECGICGDGTVDPGEECDPPDGAACGDDCRLINDDNDDCIDATPVTIGTTFFDTTDALTDGPAHQSCTLSSDGGQTFNDIWFTYYAACTGTLTVSTCEQLGGSAAYDTDLVIYDGTDCSNLQLLNCNDDDPENPCGAATGGYHSTVRASVVAGRSYLIRVGGWNTGDSGTGMLKLINDGTECEI